MRGRRGDDGEEADARIGGAGKGEGVGEGGGGEMRAIQRNKDMAKHREPLSQTFLQDGKTLAWTTAPSSRTYPWSW